MRLHEFSRLTDEEKTALLYEKGVYIGKLKKAGMVTLLFQFEGFYTEIFYRRYRRIIHSIHCFADAERLNPYLAQVEIAPFALGV